MTGIKAKKGWRNFSLFPFAFCLGCALTAGAAVAQQYPAKPLRLIVAVQPGGNLDLMGRAAAQKIGEGLGRPMIVENRPGANTVIGVEYVAKSAPDGYTFLMASPSLLVTPIMMKNPPFDPVRDFRSEEHTSELQSHSDLV